MNAGRIQYAMVGAILFVHGGMLAWAASRHSPCVVEVASVAAGVRHWHGGGYGLFSVNPPLPRMVAALPVVLAGPKSDWSKVARPAMDRPEFAVGRDFLKANGTRSVTLFFLARWACIPFSLLGACVCYCWASELFGPVPAITALSLWCFSPNIVAHGQLVSADLAATSLGVFACYLFWRWMKNPKWCLAIATGISFGLAELAKMTWGVLFFVLPAWWLVWRLFPCGRSLRPPWYRHAGQLGVVLLSGVCLINLGYQFEGSLKKLSDYQFVSRLFSGSETIATRPHERGNRFSNAWLGNVRIPLPENYLKGVDLQRSDFERGAMSYLRGEWRKGGWWYYYLYALAIKVPLGTWGLLLLAGAVALCHRTYLAGCRDELFLLTPLVVVLALVSSQTGFNHHVRYVLPILPFVFISASRVASAVDLQHWTVASVAILALASSITSSLWVYPHSLSYFNELAGGPAGGPARLGTGYVDSSFDWGQDLLYLRRWLDAHPEAQPLGLASKVEYDPRVCCIPKADRPSWVPEPGWYAVSASLLRDHTQRYGYFLCSKPVATAGYSVHIYHITPDEANRVRRKLGLPELTSQEREDGATDARRGHSAGNRYDKGGPQSLE